MNLKNIKETIKVVPHAGTWIEIQYDEPCVVLLEVVPHAGTWIEIEIGLTQLLVMTSFPTRERGLKYQMTT